MKKGTFKITIFLLVFIGISEMLYGQDMSKQQDSLRAVEILNRAEIIETDGTVPLNKNGLKLNLTEKEVLKVIEIALNSTYGKAQIRQQKPYQIAQIGRHWVVWGHIKKTKRGGVFEIVINAENLCVEYLSHGK